MTVNSDMMTIALQKHGKFHMSSVVQWLGEKSCKTEPAGAVEPAKHW